MIRHPHPSHSHLRDFHKCSLRRRFRSRSLRKGMVVVVAVVVVDWSDVLSSGIDRTACQFPLSRCLVSFPPLNIYPESLLPLLLPLAFFAHSLQSSNSSPPHNGQLACICSPVPYCKHDPYANDLDLNAFPSRLKASYAGGFILQILLPLTFGPARFLSPFVNQP